MTTHSGSGASSYGFTNEYQSQGKIYLRARHYAPSIGRFLTRDTWEGNANSPMSFNRWGYVEGNPINRTDPSGMVPCSMLPPEDQVNCVNEVTTELRERSEHPEKFDPSSPLPNFINWNPAVNINPLMEYAENTMSGQLNAGVGGNACGQIALAMILETITGQPELIGNVWKNLRTFDSTEGYPLLIAAYKSFPKDWKGSYSAYTYVTTRDFSTGKDTVERTNGNWYGDKYGSLLATKLREKIRAGHFVIPLVSIRDGNNWGTLTSAGSGHWVVLTGLSNDWKADEKSIWNWIRIRNPFANREEYYPFWLFKESMRSQGFLTVELWKKP